MGKCLGCNKKLGIFEGYESDGFQFCKKCFPKRKEFLDKKRENEEMKEKEERKKYEKETSREEDAKKILKLNDSKLRNELVHKRAKNLGKEALVKPHNHQSR